MGTIGGSVRLLDASSEDQDRHGVTPAFGIRPRAGADAPAPPGGRPIFPPPESCPDQEGRGVVVIRPRTVSRPISRSSVHSRSAASMDQRIPLPPPGRGRERQFWLLPRRLLIGNLRPHPDLRKQLGGQRIDRRRGRLPGHTQARRPRC